MADPDLLGTSPTRLSKHMLHSQRVPVQDWGYMQVEQLAPGKQSSLHPLLFDQACLQVLENDLEAFKMT